MQGPLAIPPGGRELASMAASGLLDPSAAKQLAQQGNTEEAARKLEGLFMSILVKELRKTLPGDGLFGKGPGSSVYEGFFDTSLGESLAVGVGTSLRQAIFESLSQDQAKPAPKSTNSSTQQLPIKHQETLASSDHQVMSRIPTLQITAQDDRSTT